MKLIRGWGPAPLFIAVACGGEACGNSNLDSGVPDVSEVGIDVGFPDAPTIAHMDAGSSCQSTEDLESCLPSWAQYAPPQDEQPPTEVAPPVSTEIETQAERINEEGELVQLGTVTFVCTERKYNFRDNPEKALSFNIDQTVIWPGGLIQGKSHRDESGNLLELPIRERAPISVSLTFNNENNQETVERPDNSSVGQALGRLIRNAELQGLATANNITFTQTNYSSEEQAALEFGISGKYMGFEATAKGAVERSETTNVVAARFEQQMYIAGVTQPSSPAGFFSPELTNEVLAGYADQIGPDNPPLYVSRVGYGLMMAFAMSANAESSEIRGALEAAYKGFGASLKVNLSAKQKKILESAKIQISQVGGDQGNALAAIASGDLKQYFQERTPLTSAAPIWFELKSLTGEVAIVSEIGEYTETTCVPKLPGTFDYDEAQQLNVPFAPGTQRTTHKADINGDSRMDLVFNERSTSPSVNRVHVALADNRGRFNLQLPFTHPENPSEGWENFVLRVADIDGDGRDDLVWNALMRNVNAVYTGISTGGGDFTPQDRVERAGTGWNNYTVVAGDLDGDGQDDLLWVSPERDRVRTYYALAQTDRTLDMSAPNVDRNGGFGEYDQVLLGQFDGQNGLDLAINALNRSRNDTYIALISPVSDTRVSIRWRLALRPRSGGWGSHVARAGNVDGRNGADLVWVNTNQGQTYTALNNGLGSLFLPSIVYNEGSDDKLSSVRPFIADFNNDGRSDLLLTSRTDNENRLRTGFGLNDGSFSFPAGVQTHPRLPKNEGWEAFEDVFVGDVDGDGKADVVWTIASGDARVYVARAR